eukprot:gene1188-1556_t
MAPPTGDCSMNMDSMLRLMAEKGASDVYLSVNAPVLFKINGQLVPVGDEVLPPGSTRGLL